MTTREACVLLADVMRELADARSQRDTYATLAKIGVHHAHALHRENMRLRLQLSSLRGEPRRASRAMTTDGADSAERATKTAA